MFRIVPSITDTLCLLVLMAAAYAGFGAAASADQSIISLLRDLQ
jgi:hypothetical protein